MTDVPLRNQGLLSEEQHTPDKPERVVIAREIVSRPKRMPEYARENEAFLRMLRTCANTPGTLAQVLVETASETCDADSAVLTILEPEDPPRLRWETASGALTRLTGTTMPLEATPCDMVMRERRLQLLRYPQQRYPALPAEPVIVEALLAPFAINDEPVGTLWVVSHSEGTHFDEECARLLERLATFGGIAQRLHLSNEALRRTQQALREADQRKDDFLAILAHELRNPLAPIRNAAHVLKSPKLRPADLQWAQAVISRQITQMSHLLDDLLDVSRITRNKIHLKKEMVELTSVVDSAVEAARPLIDGKNQQLSISLPPAPPAFAADPVRLTQVLTNLLTNAAKYTDPGGLIDLTARVDDKNLIVSVKDSGVGIAAEELVKLFQIFSQVSDSLNRAEGGLGIGLALTKGLVELHGGSIEARSDGVGCGSEFTVRIPLSGATDDKDVPVMDRIPKRDSEGLKILIADDNKDAAESLALLLAHAGYEVRVATGGRAAVSLAQAFRPNIAIVDIGMPDMDGYQVAESLRKQAWTSDLTMFALTGWGQSADRERARTAGYDHHLTKPVDPDRIEALIGEVAKKASRGLHKPGRE